MIDNETAILLGLSAGPANAIALSLRVSSATLGRVELKRAPYYKTLFLMTNKGWLACTEIGTVKVYELSPAGRNELELRQQVLRKLLNLQPARPVLRLVKE